MKTTHNNQTINVLTYFSLSAFLDDVAKAIGRNEARKPGASDWKWAGGRTLKQSIDYCSHGASEKEMEPARKLMDKIDASFREREKHAWLPSVAGAYPIVPEYLMGMPENMRMQQPQEDETAPIRIFIEPTVSSGVSNEELVNRGAAIAALAMRLSEERAVELYVCNGLNAANSRTGVVSAVRLDTSPINLSQIIAVLADESFIRQIVFSHTSYHSGAEKYVIGTNWIGSMPGSSSHIDAMNKCLGITKPDIFIEGGYLPDAHLMAQNPVAWVHQQVEKFRQVIED